jgi:hypothetical protein
MKGTDDRHLIIIYIYLAAGCVFIGIGLVFLSLLVCNDLGIDIVKNFWILGIPVIATLLINVLLIEVVQRIRRK